MWSALQNVGALVDQGINKATNFLEELDKGAEDDEEDEGETRDVFPVEDDRSADALLDVPTSTTVAEQDILTSGSNVEETEESDFYTPHKGPVISTTTGRKGKSSIAKGKSAVTSKASSNVKHTKEINAVGDDDSTERERFLREKESLVARNELLVEAQSSQRRELEEQLAHLQEQLREEMESRSKVEAELAHVKKVAVSPKTNKENLRVIDLLKQELLDVERFNSARLEEARLDLESKIAEGDALRSELACANDAIALHEKQLAQREGEFEQELKRMADEYEQRIIVNEKSTSGIAEDLPSADDTSQLDVNRLSAIPSRDFPSSDFPSIDELRAQVVSLSETNEELRALLYSERDKYEGLPAVSFLRSDSVCAYCVEFRDQLYQKQSEIEEMEGIISELRAVNPPAESSVEAYVMEINELKYELDELTSRHREVVNSYEEQRMEYISEIDVLRQQVENASMEMNSMHELLEMQRRTETELGVRLKELEDIAVKAEGAEMMQSSDDTSLVESMRESLTQKSIELVHLQATIDEVRVREEALLDDMKEVIRTRDESLSELAAMRESHSKDLSHIESLELSLAASLEKVNAPDAPSCIDDNKESAALALEQEKEIAVLLDAMGVKDEEISRVLAKCNVLETSIVDKDHRILELISMHAQEVKKSEDILAEVLELRESSLQNALCIQTLDQTLSDASIKKSEFELRADVLENEVMNLKVSLEESRQSCADAEAQLHELQTELDNARSSSESLDTATESMRTEVTQLRDELQSKDDALAMLEDKLNAATMQLLSEREHFDSELQDRIILNASISEELRTVREENEAIGAALRESQASEQALRDSLDELVRRLEDADQLRETSMQSISEELNVALKESIEAKSALTVAMERCNSLEHDNTALKSSIIETTQSVASRESEYMALVARAEEAESNLSLFESKKKRDLEFLRKQNENISLMQRQIEENSSLYAEKEAELRLKLDQAVVASKESSKLAERLKEALESSQQEIQTYKSKIADMSVATTDEERMEVMSNYVDNANPSSVVSMSEVHKLQERLLMSEELIRDYESKVAAFESKLADFESKIAGLMKEKESGETSFATRIEEMTKSLKHAQSKTSALEVERQRLETELLAYQKSLSDANNDSVEKDWNAYRNSSANAFTDIEIGGDSDEGGQKKDGFGIPWVFLFAWNCLVSIIPIKGPRSDKTRFAGIVVLYLAIVHTLLLYNWAYCQSVTH